VSRAQSILSHQLRPDQEKLLKSIDAGLERFSASSKNVVYWDLKQKTGMDREDILFRPLVFVNFLEFMFGTGFKTVQKEIMTKIRESFPELDSSETGDLASLIAKARRIVTE
jgi:hypothetical protein